MTRTNQPLHKAVSVVTIRDDMNGEREGESMAALGCVLLRLTGLAILTGGQIAVAAR